jgi:hypothetical protein
MTAVSQSPPQLLQYVIGGVPLSGGKLFTYLAGTTTKIATYADGNAYTQNSNPVVLDTNGCAPVWLVQGTAYKFVLSPSTDSDPPTNPIYTTDNISVPGVGTSYLGKALYYLFGSGTWTPPANVTQVKIRMWGGGGCGGSASGAPSAGGGGGSGAYIEGVINVTYGTNYSYSTGAGGSGGGNGAASTFAGGSLSLSAGGGYAPSGSGSLGVYAGGVGGSVSYSGQAPAILAAGMSGGNAFAANIGGSLYFWVTGKGGTTANLVGGNIYAAPNGGVAQFNASDTATISTSGAAGGMFGAGGDGGANGFGGTGAAGAIIIEW